MSERACLSDDAARERSTQCENGKNLWFPLKVSQAEHHGKCMDFVCCCLLLCVMGLSPFKQGKKPPPPLHSHQIDNTQARSTDRRNEWTQFSPKTFNQAWNILQNQRKKIYKLKKLAIDCERARKRNQIVIDRKIRAEKRKKESSQAQKLLTASVVGWGEERRKKLQGISWSTSILSLLEALQQLLP